MENKPFSPEQERFIETLIRAVYLQGRSDSTAQMAELHTAKMSQMEDIADKYDRLEISRINEFMLSVRGMQLPNMITAEQYSSGRDRQYKS